MSRPSTPALVALGLGLGIVALFVVFFVLLSSAGPRASGGDQCAKPVSERTGGWICPNG
jgi:hypothetical protein